MGCATNYFYDGNDSTRQTLHRRVRPSDAQCEAQQSRWNALIDFLRPKLKEASGYPLRSWLQGSYKFGTQIRPPRKGGEFDIDLGVYYCWEGPSESGMHSPCLLKSFVQEALHDFAAENDDVIKVAEPPKERCARIHFQGDFHIDVPVYHLDEPADRRSLATESDVWESSDPKAIYVWFASAFEDYRRDRVRRLVRYLKSWAALKFETNEIPSSVLLTVLSANAISRLGDALPGAEDEAFRDMVSEILDAISVGQDVRNPVDDGENLAGRMSTEHWEAFVTKLRTLRDIGVRAVECPTEGEACGTWALAFEHLFPLPDPDVITEQARSLPAVVTLPEVSVHAVSRDNRNLRYDEVNGIGPIPKNCDITFRVTNASQMPHGTTFYWMVRNEGDEAEDVNDLGHTGGTGLRADEHSSYNGVHFMDCTAVAGGRIVGIRRVPVRIRDQLAPKRNPTRPAYTSLRRRR